MRRFFCLENSFFRRQIRIYKIVILCYSKKLMG